MPDLRKIVEAIYDASAIGDFETAESHLTEDFRIEETDLVPFSGVYEGRQCLRELFPIVMGAMGVTGMERGEMMIGEQSVANKVSLTFDNPNVKPVELMEVLIFEGDKVREMRPYYFDPNQVIAACDAQAKATG